MASDFTEGYDDGYQNGVESLAPLVRELVAALKDLTPPSYNEYFCPACRYIYGDGHSPSCSIDKALTHAKEAGFE